MVLNSLTGEALARSLALLAPGGRFVEIGKQDIYGDSHIGLGFFKHNRPLHAVDIEQSVREDPRLIARLLGELVAGVRGGRVHRAAGDRLRRHRRADRLPAMAQAQHTGKLVLRPGAHEEAAVRPGAAPVRPAGDVPRSPAASARSASRPPATSPSRAPATSC